MIFIQVVAVALVLFLVLRTLQRLFLKVVVSPGTREIFLRWFPLVEIALWIGFAFWAAVSLFGESSFYLYITASMAIVLVILIGWYFLRDFMAGFILRSENRFEPGIRIKSVDSEGIISRVGYRSLELTTDEGEVIKLPYRLMAGERLIRPAEPGRFSVQPIHLEFSSRLQPDEVRQQINKRILEMPWVLSAHAPVIKLSVSADGNYRAEISVRVINEESRMKTVTDLMRFFYPINVSK